MSDRTGRSEVYDDDEYDGLLTLVDDTPQSTQHALLHKSVLLRPALFCNHIDTSNVATLLLQENYLSRQKREYFSICSPCGEVGQSVGKDFCCKNRTKLKFDGVVVLS